MAKCEICSKETKFSLQVSHSNRKTARTYKPNIQTVKTIDGTNTRKAKVCTRCIKSGKIERA